METTVGEVLQAAEGTVSVALSIHDLLDLKTSLATQMWHDESARDREVRDSREWKRRNARKERIEVLYCRICRLLEERV